VQLCCSDRSRPSAFATSAFAEKVADCDFNLDWPHESHHVPGTVDSMAVIKCNTSKKYLGVEVWLTKLTPYVDQDYDSYVSNSGTGKWAGATAALGCSGGTFQARAEFLMVDHNDTRYERSHSTPVITLSCQAK
jgi:hypothetical protein